MDVVDLSRWQFAITTVYHFLFVPITIGLSGIVAGFETTWLWRRNPQMLRLAKFFGKLLTINFALGLVTGLVQEFQFGMNWSAYSAFVGDIFGAPLALEALLAFFLESVFLGLWIFGRGRLPEKLHVMCIWLVHIGTLLSAYFILAANSFMQNPVGYRFNPESGRVELTDFMALLTNKVQVITFPHIATAAYLTGGALVMGVGLWLMHRHRGGADAPMYRSAARIGAVITLVAGAGAGLTGDLQGKVMTEVQPMKMAAAEALYETKGACAEFSILTIGSLDGQHERFQLTVPCMLSFFATGSFDGRVEGINNLKAELPAQIDAAAQQRGQPAHYVTPRDAVFTPFIPLTYWSFRFMVGIGIAAAGVALLVLWYTRRGGFQVPRLIRLVIYLSPLSPLLGNSFGWIFTETGRQPWLVYGVMTTSSGVSPSLTAADVIISMTVFTLLYGALAVVEVKLFLDYTRKGADPFEEPKPLTESDELSFAY